MACGFLSESGAVFIEVPKVTDVQIRRKAVLRLSLNLDIVKALVKVLSGAFPPDLVKGV